MLKIKLSIMADENKNSEILSVDNLLQKKLNIPYYQRPYKWTSKNIMELIFDIQKSIEDSKNHNDFKYRIGTIILHKDKDRDYYDIVDGQQRIISLLLLKYCLDKNFSSDILDTKFSIVESQVNIQSNYKVISQWISSIDEQSKNEFRKAFSNILEVVLIVVEDLSSAFQLFDSQNSRGKALYPHDLLKAYHLREIKDKYDMQEAVSNWEAVDPKQIQDLFNNYLYPLWNWSKKLKSGNFTTSEIDIYKGIELSSGYTYADRANRASPAFLITDSFISGKDFFLMVAHYIRVLYNVKHEIISNTSFVDKIKNIIQKNKKNEDKIKSVEELEKFMNSLSAGYRYAINLFFCTLLFYYDRFHNFDAIAVKKIFTWAMMIRLDMERLGFDTINKYAVGDGSNAKYSNNIAFISNIALARRHTDISKIHIKIDEESEKWSDLY